MGGDDELGILFQIVHLYQQLHQPVGRQCRFRFVQDVQTVTAETVLYQREETLSVGLFM